MRRVQALKHIIMPKDLFIVVVVWGHVKVDGHLGARLPDGKDDAAAEVGALRPDAAHDNPPA